MGSENAVLLPVQEGDIWRVQITWPNGAVHYVGRFASEKEASKYVVNHAWWARYKIQSSKDAEGE